MTTHSTTVRYVKRYSRSKCNITERKKVNDRRYKPKIIFPIHFFATEGDFSQRASLSRGFSKTSITICISRVAVYSTACFASFASSFFSSFRPFSVSQSPRDSLSLEPAYRSVDNRNPASNRKKKGDGNGEREKERGEDDE